MQIVVSMVNIDDSDAARRRRLKLLKSIGVWHL